MIFPRFVVVVATEAWHTSCRTDMRRPQDEAARQVGPLRLGTLGGAGLAEMLWFGLVRDSLVLGRAIHSKNRRQSLQCFLTARLRGMFYTSFFTRFRFDRRLVSVSEGVVELESGFTNLWVAETPQFTPAE